MIDTRPVCDYEGSTYQADFWEKGGREYEDRAERIALQALLPGAGRLFLELGAGAGRLTPLLGGFEHVVLLDYSRTQLLQAQARLGAGERYTYVAANVYELPFAPGVFDGGMMVRVMHHLVDAPAALKEIGAAFAAGGVLVVEFANKRNWKAILRYWLRRQNWNPFSPEPVQFAKLNFDFHPRAVRRWLADAGFEVRRQRTVSHYRLGLIKKLVPPNLLAAADGLIQPTGNWIQFSPSVFVRAEVRGQRSEVRGRIEGSRSQTERVAKITDTFRCPICKGQLEQHENFSQCTSCSRRWGFKDGIYNFKEAL